MPHVSRAAQSRTNIVARAVLTALVVLFSDFRARAVDLPPALVIDNCSVFDSTTGTMQVGRTIVIRGERIESVTAADEPLDVPADAVRVDGSGKFAIPGLIDTSTSHV
jgi:imidazolonepropionase-like amidohydrolase